MKPVNATIQEVDSACRFRKLERDGIDELKDHLCKHVIGSHADWWGYETGDVNLLWWSRAQWLTNPSQYGRACSELASRYERRLARELLDTAEQGVRHIHMIIFGSHKQVIKQEVQAWTNKGLLIGAAAPVRNGRFAAYEVTTAMRKYPRYKQQQMLHEISETLKYRLRRKRGLIIAIHDPDFRIDQSYCR